MSSIFCFLNRRSRSFDGEIAFRGRKERIEGLLSQLDERGGRRAQAEVDLEEGGW